MEIRIDLSDLDNFYQAIRDQTEQMYSYWSNVELNVPQKIESFAMNPSSLCKQCRFQELCFPERRCFKPAEGLDFLDI
jgi:hypothetical protein